MYSFTNTLAAGMIGGVTGSVVWQLHRGVHPKQTSFSSRDEAIAAGAGAVSALVGNALSFSPTYLGTGPGQAFFYGSIGGACSKKLSEKRDHPVPPPPEWALPQPAVQDTIYYVESEWKNPLPPKYVVPE